MSIGWPLTIAGFLSGVASRRVFLLAVSAFGVAAMAAGTLTPTAATDATAISARTPRTLVDGDGMARQSTQHITVNAVNTCVGRFVQESPANERGFMFLGGG